MTDLAVPSPHWSEIWKRRLTQLAPLNGMALEAMQQSISQLRQVRPREQVLRDGASDPMLRVLLAGFACRYKYLPDGRRQITAFILPGDICDFGFLADMPVSQEILALSPSTIGSMEVEKLAAVAEAHPQVTTALLRAAVIEQNTAHELVASLGGRNALHRVGHFLCEIHHRLHAVGAVRAAGQFELPLTQSEIGEALGLSTVHVNRTLQTLRRLGLATVRDRLATLPDPAGLATFCAFDPAYLRPGGK